MAITNHDGPVAQLSLLHAVVLSGWSTSLDHKVAAVIISRYYPKYSGARASLRFLEGAIGSTRPNIITSIRRLVSHGAFSVKVEGKGTRPTEYNLNFDFPSGIAHDTSTSGTVHNTSCGIAGETSIANSGIAHDTKTYLHVPAYNAGIHEGRNFSAPPSAPLSDGLKATDAEGVEGDGFEAFWKIWPRKHGIKKACAEWDKVATKDDVITAARAWAEHYDKHGTDKKWIAEPANWIAGERWMEDLPIIHGDAKGAAIAKAKANAPLQSSSDDQPEFDIPAMKKPDFTIYPDEIAEGTIERVDDWTDPEDGAKMLTIYYRTHRGEEIEQLLVYESDDVREQENGQKDLRLLLEAVGLDSVDHAHELLGRKVDLMINGGKFVSCSKPWVPAPKEPRLTVRFADVVKNTPMGGWSKMIGTAPMSEDEAER